MVVGRASWEFTRAHTYSDAWVIPAERRISLTAITTQGFRYEPINGPEEPEEAELVPMALRKGVGREQATEEVVQFVSAHPGSDAIDIADGLRLSLVLVEGITADLISHGTLREGR